MRKTLRFLPYIIGMALLMGMVSCSKDGPAGATGPAGPAGPGGPAGPAGPAGQTGTANVIYSDWLDVTFDTVWNQTRDTVLAYTATIPAPKLDSAILTTGEVKVYMNVNSANDPVVYPLPIFDLYELAGVLNVNLYFYIGGIDLYATHDPSTFTDNNIKYYQFRYILIPGGTHAKTMKPINWNNYKEVQAYLGLKD
jgi:hypothetical protein